MKTSVIELIGTNHKFSDLQTREKLTFHQDELEHYLKKIKSFAYVKEVMILSTCNRIEMLIVSGLPISDRIVEFLSEYSGLDVDKLYDILYIKRNIEAVRHIFRVASSLDSMVIGEPQILGQIKDAYKWSVEFMTSGATINRIMRRAFHAAKVVKTKTDISKGAVSVAYAAVLKSKKIMNLDGKKVLSIGVSEMNRLACEHFSQANAEIAYIANRTKENALELAKQYNAQLIGLDELKDVFLNVDIVVTSTASKTPIINKEFIPKNRKLLIIDMAIPKDTQDGVEDFENIELIFVDDLKNVVDESMRFRKKQSELAEEIINNELKAYIEYIESLDYDEIIKKLRIIADRIRQTELNKFKKRYKDKIDENILEGVDMLTRSLLNKVLHEPTRNIKMFMEHPEGDMYIELLKRIFKIEHSKKDVKCFFSENS